MQLIFEKRKYKENPTLEKFLLERNFLNAHRAIARLPSLNPTQLKVYLFKKGFQKESKSFFKENVNGKCFILIMTCVEGIELLGKEFKFSIETIERMKHLYKNIHLFRKKYCKLFEEVKEQPFY